MHNRCTNELQKLGSGAQEGQSSSFAFKLFETKRERLTNLTASAALYPRRATQTNYFGRDADKYKLASKLVVAVEQAKSWIEFHKGNCEVVAIPLAVFNDGGAPATGIVVEVRVPVELCVIMPFDAPEMPGWAIRQHYRNKAIPRDRVWIWRPVRSVLVDVPVDNHTYTARERRQDPPFGKPYEIDVQQYHYRTEISAQEDSYLLWRYRVENELPHGEGVALAECLILSPTKNGEFRLDYSIRARELPEPVNGIITVNLSGFELGRS